ncbi:hypothetical protein [Streptomyces rameus]|uniref:hypothetical protein n=1 Tax=Streptomyces rameus TaxID=68261 RepID=UPI003CD05EAD
MLISLPPSKPRLSEPTTASALTDCESITLAVGSASRPSLSRILDCSRLCELAVFRANLARDPNSEAYQFLFHVYGLAGVGKSTLIRRWEAVAREEGAATAVVGEEAVSAVEAISSRLARQGCPLKAFDKQLSYYRQKCHEAEAAMAGLLPDGDDPGAALVPSPASALAAQIGMVGLSLVPGVGVFSGVIRPATTGAGSATLTQGWAAQDALAATAAAQTVINRLCDW